MKKWTENLNLGSGVLMWADYLNFDQRLYKKNRVRTNVIGRIEELPFKPGSFKKIVCSHVIEHFYKTDALEVIRDCYDLLKPGGFLTMEGPCILGCYWYYVEVKKDVSRFIDFIYGGEDNRLEYGDEYAHRCGWTGDLMSKEMKNVGFEIIHVGIGRFHGMGRRDFRVEGKK